MLSSTTNLNNSNLNTSVAFRRRTSTYPFSRFVTTNQNPSSLSSYPDLPEEEEETATFNSSNKGSRGEYIYDDGIKKNVSYRSSPRSSAILGGEAQQHQQLSISNKRKMAMLLSEEKQEEDHLSPSEATTSEGPLREEEDIIPSASNNDEQERQIQEPDNMMSTASAVVSLVVEKENTTMDDPTTSSSSNNNIIVRRKNQTNKKRKLTVRFDLVSAVGARPFNEKKSPMMRRMKKSFGQQRKISSSSSSSTTTTGTCRYKVIYDDDDNKSTLWWTPAELKHIELSAVFALKMKELGLFPPIIADTDILSLQRYTKQNRIQRKNIRKQMYLTVQAIKDFEIIIKTKTPPELLSELLQRITTRKPTTTFMEPVATILDSNSNVNAKC